MNAQAYLEELEYRRGAWKAIAEAATKYLPPMGAALARKIDEDLVQILKDKK